MPDMSPIGVVLVAVGAERLLVLVHLRRLVRGAPGRRLVLGFGF
jgi:hypothetical protein